jgi:hypothetical protein
MLIIHPGQVLLASHANYDLFGHTVLTATTLEKAQKVARGKSCKYILMVDGENCQLYDTESLGIVQEEYTMTLSRPVYHYRCNIGLPYGNGELRMYR